MKYTIDHLSNIADVNKITIRSWEERHDFIIPKRSKTNIRHYELDDLICIVNVKALLTEKVKISNIACLSYQEILEAVDDKFHEKTENFQVYISRIIRSALLYDRNLFDNTIYNGFLKFGLSDFYLNIMYPSLQKIGYIWKVKSKDTNHEKTISALLQTKINDITHEIIETKRSKDIWLLFMMSPYIFLDRDNSHFIPLFETTKMVESAEKKNSD